MGDWIGGIQDLTLLQKRKTTFSRFEKLFGLPYVGVIWLLWGWFDLEAAAVDHHMLCCWRMSWAVKKSEAGEEVLCYIWFKKKAYKNSLLPSKKLRIVVTTSHPENWTLNPHIRCMLSFHSFCNFKTVYIQYPLWKSCIVRGEPDTKAAYP